MATVVQNFTAADEWYVGEDKTLNIAVVDVAGAAVNITGWTLEWVLRLRPSNPTKLISKTIGSGITVTNAAGGLLTIQVARADSVNLHAGRYYHGLARTNSASYDITVDGYADLLRSAAS